MAGIQDPSSDYADTTAPTGTQAHPLTPIALRLSAEVTSLSFGPPVTHVYNPLEYAWPAHETYLRRYGTPPREIILLGVVVAFAAWSVVHYALAARTLREDLRATMV